MRTLKFRIWNGTEMVYDVMVGRFGAFYVNPGEKGDGLNPSDMACVNLFNTKYPDDIPVMQFTGLTDKNGKYIYEGDIVKCHDHPTGIEDCVGEVYYQHGKFMVKGSIVPLGDFGTAWVEIIGNIYETKTGNL